ncbi:CHAP domain-containing protein [Microbispora sp. NPDC088329]|uniref:CHAP domain-containing protein n=1 Tax=Microbispora sp. NPDC088329 TaxID=3154869 RepID=UPI003447ED73
MPSRGDAALPSRPRAGSSCLEARHEEPAISTDPIARQLLDAVRPELGYRERAGKHTKFGEWYADTIAKDPDFRTAPWCDMFVSWAANQAGVQDRVGEFALTTRHAKWFKEHDAWSGTPEPGAVVFFDWSGSKKIRDIDHVGVVEKVVHGKVHTIEGNVDGVWLKRKVRDKSKIVGYGLPRKVKVTPKAPVTIQPVAAVHASVPGAVGLTIRNLAATQGQSPGVVWSPGDAVLPAGLLFAVVSTAVTGLRVKAAAATSGGRHRKRGPGRVTARATVGATVGATTRAARPSARASANPAPVNVVSGGPAPVSGGPAPVKPAPVNPAPVNVASVNAAASGGPASGGEDGAPRPSIV